MANLSASELLKYDWRRKLFLEKHKKQDVFVIAGGNKVRLLVEEDNINILKKGKYDGLSKIEFNDAKVKSRKYKLTSFEKTVEFGGKPEGAGAGVGIEMREINSINKQLDEIRSKTGSKIVPIIIDDKIYNVAKCNKTPGVPKSDFYLTDDAGNEIAWISHKEGSNPNDFQQWGGMTDPVIANHPESQAFIEKVKKMFPDGMPSATTVAREIESKDLINYSVYGTNYNKAKKYSRDNVNIVLQGAVKLIKEGKNWKFTSNHTLENGDRLTSGFVPVFMAIYKGDRSNFGVKGARFAIQPKLSKSDKMDMIRLLEYLENKNKKGTLNIFDIDDTLFRSESRVLVKKNDKIVKSLNTDEFNKYKLKRGEEFDFSQFRSSKMFYTTAVPIDRMIDRAHRAVKQQNPGDKTILLTARSDFDNKSLFLQKFRDNGFPIDKVYVERAGNLNLKPDIAKGIYIKKYLDTGKFDTIRMWDDSEKNLIALNNVAGAYKNVKIQGFLVDPKTGNTSRYI